MTASVLNILGSLSLLVVVLGSVRIIGRRFGLHPEVQRKVIHVGLGLYALTIPVVFAEAWQVTVLCGLAVILLALVRTVPPLRNALGGGLHGVERFSLGEIFFALSIALLFYLSGDNVVLYVLPLLILTLCDAAAALVGVAYGKTTYVIDEGRKSVEGTTAFFLIAWLLSIIALLSLSDVPRTDAVVVALIVAVFGALIEAASWKGLDNIFVPLCLFLLLERILFIPIVELLLISLSFFAFLAATTWIGRKYWQNLHAIVTVVTAAFFIWIVGGWANLAAPLAVFAVYLYTKFRDGEADSREDDLPMVLSVISTALLWYVVSMVFDYNTYFVFSLSFGIHLVVLGLVRPGVQGFWFAAGFALFAWMVTNVRVLFVTDFQTQDIVLSATALLVLATTAFGVASTRTAFESLRWVKQAGLALIGTGISLPVTVLL